MIKDREKQDGKRHKGAEAAGGANQDEKNQSGASTPDHREGGPSGSREIPGEDAEDMQDGIGTHGQGDRPAASPPGGTSDSD